VDMVGACVASLKRNRRHRRGAASGFGGLCSLLASLQLGKPMTVGQAARNLVVQCEPQRLLRSSTPGRQADDGKSDDALHDSLDNPGVGFVPPMRSMNTSSSDATM